MIWKAAKTMNIDKLQYIFDPLCGWCYASAPALEYLAKTYPEKLQLLPCGLFSQEGARPISAQWASHAWTNDQRIASLTGQRFSEEYHQLLQSGAYFDSQYLNCALTAFSRAAPSAEPGLLHEFQLARYVRGLDTSRSEVVAQISHDYAVHHQLDIHFPAASDPFAADSALYQHTQERISTVKKLMRATGVSGVPLLLVTVAGKTQAISGSALYGGPAAISNALKQLSSN